MASSGINQLAMDKIRNELYKSVNEEQTGEILDKLVPKNKYNNENKKEENNIMSTKKNTTKTKNVKRKEKKSMIQEGQILELEVKTPEEIAAEEQFKREMEEKAKLEAEKEIKKKVEKEEKELKEKLEAEKEDKKKKQEEEDKLFEEEEFKRMQEAKKQYEEEKKKTQEEEKIDRMKQQEEKIKKEYEKNIQAIKEELNKKQGELKEKEEKKMNEDNQEPKLTMDEVQKMIEEALAKQMEEIMSNNVKDEDKTKINDDEIEIEDTEQVISEMINYLENNYITILRKIALAFDLPYNYFELKNIDLDNLIDSDIFVEFCTSIYYEKSCIEDQTLFEYMQDVLINKLNFSEELVYSLKNIFINNKDFILGFKDKPDEDIYKQLCDEFLTEINDNEKISEEEILFKVFVKFYEEIKRIVEDKDIPSIIIEEYESFNYNENEDQQEESLDEEEILNDSELAKIIREMKRNGELELGGKKKETKFDGLKDKYESTKIGLATSIASERMKRQYYKLKKAIR